MKTRKKLLVLLLSFALAFTMMAVPAYADGELEAAPADPVVNGVPEENLNTEVPEEQVNTPEEEPVTEEVTSVDEEPTAEDADAVSDNSETVAEPKETEPVNKVPKVQAAEENADENGTAEEPSEPEKLAYDGENVNFIKADGSQYGMFKPQEGTTCKFEGDNVVIHYIPKNTTTYIGFNWGSIEDEKYKNQEVRPEAEVKPNSDGSYDITFSKDHCGYAFPVAVVKKTWKADKPSWTSEDQFYLAVPPMDEIVRDLGNAVLSNVSNQTYTGKAITPAVEVTYKNRVLVKDEDYTLNYSNNVNKGTATLTVKGIGKYSGNNSKTFVIGAKMITPAVTLSNTALIYTGKAQQPAVSAVYDGRTKLPASAYTAKVTSGKNIGTYNVSVTLKGNYVGSKTVSYQIVPKGATIKAPKKAKKALTVKWKAQKAKMPKARVAGYQIQLATDKAFTKNVKNVNVKGHKKTSKKIKKLQAKTIYYVRIRTYIKVSGKTYYSAWSAVKSAKTK